MPNHCENDLYISGPAADVAALLEHIGADKEKPEFDFNKVIPYPERFAKLDAEYELLGWQGFEDRYGPNAKDGFNSGGHEWRVENWGTKWGAYSVMRRDYEGLCITFQTAWSPPRNIIEWLHKAFPKCSLHLEFFERGGAFCGGFSVLSEEDWYSAEGKTWEPGVRSHEWKGEYLGTRGG